MLKKIEIDGFKTLSNFAFKVSPGLNILVGPNGSGKTNILSFFEFLGNLQEMSVSNAISCCGGAGSVFKKEGENKYQPFITATIFGSINLEQRKFLHYQYEFVIKIHKSIESIYFQHQRIKSIYSPEDIDVFPEDSNVILDLDLEKYVNDDLVPITTIHRLDGRKIKTRFLGRDNSSKKQIIKHIERLFNDHLSLEDGIPAGGRYFYDEIALIHRDIKGGKIYNIEPSRVKIPEDSAQSPGIQKDGTGLYSTLYAIKKKKRKSHGGMLYQRILEDKPLGKTTLKEILQYVQLANEAIEDINVFNDTFDNQLQIRIAVSGVSECSLLPLSAMSDGTIKWITLLTILLTNKSIYSIEEPENYLHPLMQTEFMEIVRNEVTGNRFILISTHSETLLNNATPEELVVISFENGCTHANRPSNAEDINKEIEETGFGLGYYYISGGLEND